MRIFVFEFITGGGLLGRSGGEDGFASLAAEAEAMVRALVTDFAAVAGVSVDVLRDARWADWREAPARVTRVARAEDERRAFGELAAAADWTVVIAPETDGVLVERCRRVEGLGGRRLGPGLELTALASDKHRTAEHLKSRGIRVPDGVVVPRGARLPPDFSCPAIAKPLDGAGGVGVEWLPNRAALLASAPVATERRLEVYCAGFPASVAAISGPTTDQLLPACSQRFSSNLPREYSGGELLVDASLAARARRLASRALSQLPGRCGFLGFDLVLGADPHGADDVVIEVNPRLTTSYVGLRAATTANLAQAMLELAVGRPYELRFELRPLQFDAAGNVTRYGPAGFAGETEHGGN